VKSTISPTRSIIVWYSYLVIDVLFSLFFFFSVREDGIIVIKFTHIFDKKQWNNIEFNASFFKKKNLPIFMSGSCRIVRKLYIFHSTSIFHWHGHLDCIMCSDSVNSYLKLHSWGQNGGPYDIIIDKLMFGCFLKSDKIRLRLFTERAK
jgi:hypothetical protein